MTPYKEKTHPQVMQTMRRFVMSLTFVMTIFCWNTYTSSAFLLPIRINKIKRANTHSGTPFGVALTQQQRNKSSLFATDNDDATDDDEELLKTITKEHLLNLCSQCNLSLTKEETESKSKEELLTLLREYAQTQAQIDQEQKQKRMERIEQGFNDDEGNGKAKHKIIPVTNDEQNDDNAEDDMEGVFYFDIGGDDKNGKDSKKTDNDTKVTKTTMELSEVEADMKKVEQEIKDSRMSVTSPQPPANIKPNADGERVVTIYSSNDQNDLTGMTAQSSASTSMMGSDVAMMGGNTFSASSNNNALKPEDTLAAGPFGDQTGSQRRKASEKEVEEAKDAICELVQSLLAMTGAPGFQDDSMLMEGDDEEDGTNPISAMDGNNKVFSEVASFGFVGFDPSRVPTSILTQNSKALRVSGGEVLMEVMTDFEMRAIGLDGRHGDNKDRGGGHYMEVQKVTTFLEGFRKAEVRKVSRETATMLLDKLVTEGVKGLDDMLMVMTRGDEDSSDAGELNDSLIQYLDGAIREQERKVEKMSGVQGIQEAKKVLTTPIIQESEEIDDFLSSQWNVTVGKDGEVVESLDPNDPMVKQALERELKAAEMNQQARAKKSLSLDPAEQLLTLLMLLKERVKAEAAFSNDEKGRNLRVLAYCLHSSTDQEREKIIMDRFGTTLDQLDSFSELLASSIDYAKSTSHQLQPSKSGPLNIRLLQSIKDIADDIKERQSWKATGVSS